MQWLRRSFITGFFVTVPLVVSVAAIVWAFRFVDDFATPVAARIIGRDVPGIGVLIMAAFVLGVGATATNVIGKRILQRTEAWLLRIPVFKTVYAPVRQLVAAFSPDNDAGFKRVVLVDDPARGLVLGFLTREFSLDRGKGTEDFVAVYVPTNHLYLGDIVAFPSSHVHYPELSVEDGIRIFLTGGMALPQQLRSGRGPGRV
ncbi:MAG: DUF502 domain-containing protein [Vicinamibacterales bacterium]